MYVHFLLPFFLELLSEKKSDPLPSFEPGTFRIQDQDAPATPLRSVSSVCFKKFGSFVAICPIPAYRTKIAISRLPVTSVKSITT